MAKERASLAAVTDHSFDELHTELPAARVDRTAPVAQPAAAETGKRPATRAADPLSQLLASKDKEPMGSQIVDLPLRNIERLKKIKDQHGVSIAASVRYAVEKYLYDVEKRTTAE